MTTESKQRAAKTFAKSVLLVSTIVAVSIPFSIWAVNAESIGQHDLGLALLFSVLTSYSIITALIISAFSLIATFIYKLFYADSWKYLFYSFLISLLSPILIEIWPG